MHGGGSRPDLTEAERDDAKQVIALAVSGIQRERAAADGAYTRGRNAVGVTATLFAAVQAAFVASVGRESGHHVLLRASERGHLLVPASIGAALLLIALGMLLFWLDKARPLNAVGGLTLRDMWLDKHSKHTDVAVLDLLALGAIEEEEEWAKANAGRDRALRWIGRACGVAGLAVLVELVMLYAYLT